MPHPYVYNVRQVLRVVDGDTIDAVISLGFGLTAAIRFRLAGIDAPEARGRYATPAGQDATAFVTDWLTGRHLHVHTYKGSQSTVGVGDGAFGRWLADFTDSHTGERLADALAHAGHTKGA